MKNKNYYKKIVRYFLVLFIISSTSQSVSVFAVDTQFYQSNDILFYSDSEVSQYCASASVVNADTRIASYTKDSGNLSIIYNALTKPPTNNTSLTAFTPVQASAIMGNFFAESGFNPGIEEKTESPRKGFGLAQWTGGRRDKLLKFAQDSGLEVTDIQLQINFLYKEYYDTYKAILSNKIDGREPVFTNIISKDVKLATIDWVKKFEAPLMVPGSDDPAALYSKRIPMAEKTYSIFNNSSSVNGSSTSDCSADYLNKSSLIVNTALKYAWPTRKRDEPAFKAKSSDNNSGPTWFELSKESYQQDFPTVYPDAARFRNSIGYWTDCGKFVDFVMITSGVDKKYTTSGNTTQDVTYIKDHPELYDLITSKDENGKIIPPSMSQLKAGDILVYRAGGGSDHAHAAIFYKDNSVINASSGGTTPAVEDGMVQYMLGIMKDKNKQSSVEDWVVGRIK